MCAEPAIIDITLLSDLQRLQVAIKSANLGLWDWDLRTGRVTYSEGWKQQLGYAPDEIGDSFAEWQNRVHPDDLAHSLQFVWDFVAAPGSHYELEFRLRHKDGSYRNILAQGSLECDENGKPVYLFGSHTDLTPIRLAEEALRKSEMRYHSLFENNHSVMLLIDPETGAIVDANAAAVSYYGWTREQLRSMTIYAINQLSPAQVAAEMARAVSEERKQFLFDHLLADGSVRNVEVYSGPIVVGEQTLLYSIVHDITERRQAEAALQRSEATLQRSQAVAHVGHWMWDTSGNIVTWSDEMKRIFGLDPATFDGDLSAVIAQCVHPDDLARVVAANDAVLYAQHPAVADYRVVWPDGSIRYVRGIPGDYMQDSQGKIVQLSGVAQDITERTLIEIEREQLLQQVREQADRMVQVMRSVPEGVLLLDSDCLVLLANPLASDILTQLALYDEQGRLTTLAGVELDGLLTAPPIGQWHTLHFAGCVFELIARPLEDGPLLAGWVVVIRDVTVEKTVEQQLQRQERLAAVGQLAAGIAHDFNNILSVITIYVELLSAATVVGEQERAYIATIISQSTRATRMIRQILDFSRQSILERQSLDLLPLFKEVEKLLRQTLPENIEMNFVYAPGEYCVLADPTRIQQLLMNLVVNAREAMPHGGALRIELSHCAMHTDASLVLLPDPQLAPLREPPGKGVRIVVQDNGVGISAESMPHIFEPFFTTKGPGKGTGLGLAQAHGIVAQHQGQIFVSSEPGAGATFTVFLPAHQPRERITASAAERPRLPQGNGETVLIVEDDAALRASLLDLLELLNYATIDAANGEEALACLEGGVHVDAIVSDVVMPRLGGIALVRRLRQNDVHTPVILISGHPKGEEPENIQDLDVRAWLEKPPSTQRLAYELASALMH